MSPAWDPPAFLLVAAAAAAIAAWLYLSPPGREGPLSAALQAGAAILLALVLVNAGWRSGAAGARPRLVVLLDRSASMAAAGAGGTTRLDAARAWLASEEFSGMTSGWQVDLDSFGGGTTDPAAAIEAASASLPEAILVISDGRAAGGRAAGFAPVPMYARIPGPVAVIDAAVLGLAIMERESGAAVSIEVAAVGGAPTPARPISVLVDGSVAVRASVPALAAGERREIRAALPPGGGGEAVVEARLEAPADAVAGNDRRSLVRRSSPPARTLLVGLAPGWEIGFLRRALEASTTVPIDAYWGAVEGSLRAVDGGGSAAWNGFDPARYETLWVVGDPALLGAAGRRWVERFAALGGRGIFWAPGGAGGELAGLRVPAGASTPAAPPALTEAGRRWLAAVVGELGRAPDGSRDWPPLEGLPAGPIVPTGGAVVLLQAGGRPVAWSLERGGNRHVVALGTGWYRLALVGGGDGAPRRFWRAWTEGAARWLLAASRVEAPLVTMPPDGRVAVGDSLVARRIEGTGHAEWRVVPAAGGAPAASGVAEEGAGAVVVPPLPAGAWRLHVGTAGRRESHAFAVEAWTPDLARTEADSASLAAAARASGGGVLVGSSPPLAAPPPAGRLETGPPTLLALVPWGFLLAALFLVAHWLAHWAAAARAR